VVASRKYYWLKLKRDFFKRHDIRIIEEMQNGKDYILFYLKLLLESIDHEGNLRFSDAIPYNEKMLSVVTNTNVDIVKAAMELFLNLGMIEVLDDETIYMNEVEKLIGSETTEAEKKRLQRAKKDNVGTLEGHCPDFVPQSKRKSKRKDKDIELDAVAENGNGNGTENVENSTLEFMGGTLGKGVVLLSEAQRDKLLDELGLDAFNHYISKLADFIIDNKANVRNHYETIRKWAREDARA
jgi:predicted phage replisome organizer